MSFASLSMVPRSMRVVIKICVGQLRSETSICCSYDTISSNQTMESMDHAFNQMFCVFDMSTTCNHVNSNRLCDMAGSCVPMFLNVCLFLTHVSTFVNEKVVNARNIKHYMRDRFLIRMSWFQKVVWAIRPPRFKNGCRLDRMLCVLSFSRDLIKIFRINLKRHVRSMPPSSLTSLLVPNINCQTSDGNSLVQNRTSKERHSWSSEPLNNTTETERNNKLKKENKKFTTNRWAQKSIDHHHLEETHDRRRGKRTKRESRRKQKKKEDRENGERGWERPERTGGRRQRDKKRE